MTTAILVAKERQLDWLLEEALGAARGGERPAARDRHRWLAAALVALAVGTAFGVGWLRRDGRDAREAQQPVQDGTWHEAHGAAGLDTLPPDVVSLRCFDFDDAAMAQLARFPKLEQLDLSGMDVDARGVSRSLPITDAGVAHLAGLTNLRWLCLATCHQVKGETLHVLEALPRLEHLDLTYTGVESPAVERLQRLPSLRELSLAQCRAFHGRSLAEVAKLPGLRQLQLQGCTTLTATDVAALGKMASLRYLDLRDCQGRYRGQTAGGLRGRPGPPVPLSTEDEEPLPPPTEDGIGITDDVLAALAALSLESLLLGGSESLTDAIGPSLAKMTTLRALDLSNLPKLTEAVFASLPPQLESLFLHGSGQLFLHLHEQPELPALRELSLPVDEGLSDPHLDALLATRRLQALRLDDANPRTKAALAPARRSQLTGAAGATIGKQRELRRLTITNGRWVDERLLQHVAELPHLTELDLTGATGLVSIANLGSARSLRRLKLMWCTGVDAAGLRALTDVPLRDLDLYGTKLDPAAIREVARSWPDCTIRMPNGQTWRTPGPK
jgi:Leucine-rich repeat (LRR) protein